MNKSCCIFFYEGYIDVAPTIINLAISFNQQGYLVKIYATNNNYPKFRAPNDQITVVYFLKGYDIPIINSFYKFFAKIKLHTLVPLIESFLFLLQCAVYTLRNYQAITPSNSINIGVDTNGSIVSLLKFYLFRRKFAYLSLEIADPKKFKKLSKIVKFLECLAYRKAECIIIQDEDRFESLCNYNKHKTKNVFYLPNSPMSSDFSSHVIDTNYFRDIFKLSKEKFPSIIIQAGMICDEVFSQELAYAFNFINNGCALIFHERQKRDIQEDYLKSLQEINSNNLFLSLEPVPFEEIDKIFVSATIGLAFYRDIDNNFSQIAKASGKLAYYLKHGKPVLVNNLESLRMLVQKYNIGVVVQNTSDPIEIQLAIESILDNYSLYSENAKACFAEEFDFANKIKPLLSLMNSW